MRGQKALPVDRDRTDRRGRGLRPRRGRPRLSLAADVLRRRGPSDSAEPVSGKDAER